MFELGTQRQTGKIDNQSCNGLPHIMMFGDVLEFLEAVWVVEEEDAWQQIAASGNRVDF